MNWRVQAICLVAGLGTLGCSLGTGAEDADRLDLLEADAVLDVRLGAGALERESSSTGSTAFSESSVLRTYDVDPDQRLSFAGQALRAAASAGWLIGPPVDERCENGVLYISGTKDYGPWTATLLLIVNLEDGGDEVTMELTAPNAERHPGEANQHEFPARDAPEVPCAG